MKTKRIDLELPVEVIYDLKAAAKLANCSVNKLVNVLIAYWLVTGRTKK